MVGALLLVLCAIAAPPPAFAGTYDVVSCGAPGAGGINRAWRPEASGFPPNVAPDPSSYVISDQCPAQLLIQTAPPPANAPFLTGGNWILDAPAGTRITRLETWRFGAKLRTGATNPEGDPWRIFARDRGAQIIGGVFGETCTAPEGSIGCSFGSDTGISAASHATYPINVDRISYAISCENYSGCPRYYDDGTNRAAIATIKVFGTRVTITDNVRPGLRVGGALTAAGWRRPGDVLTADATDSAGVRAVRLELAGRARRLTRSCDFRLTAPCPTRNLSNLRVPDGTPDGTHAARIVAEDTAGNETATARTISVDGTVPRVKLLRARGRKIVLAVNDDASGLAGATLEVRRNSTEPFSTPKTTLSNGRLRATLTRRRASKVDMRVTVRDNAGNVAQGSPVGLKATSARVGRRTRKVRAGRVRIPFGRSGTLRGRLTLAANRSLAGQTIVATSTVRRRGAPSLPAGGAVTNRRGRFSIKVPAGPSRTYRLAFNGAPGAFATDRSISVRVPASTTIRASRTRLSGAGRVRFSGRLRTRGARIPTRGLVVVLQGRSVGKWRTFADTRTNRKGRWRASYVFRGQRGSYPIRVRIRKQAGFPFDLGYSRRLTVRVG